MERTEDDFWFENASRPSEAVVMAVADQTGQDATEMTPLYDVIDPDALDALFQGDKPGRVSFDYAGCKVTVTGHEEFTVICERLMSDSETSVSERNSST